MTDTLIFYVLVLGLLFFLAYRLSRIMATLDSLADMLGDQLYSILDELRKDGNK